MSLEEVTKALKKPMVARTGRDGEKINEFLWGIKFFRDIYGQIEEESIKKNCEPPSKEEFMASIAQELVYSELPRGQLVFHCGDFGDKMYIVLSGSINIYIKKSLEELMKTEELNAVAAQKAEESSKRRNSKLKSQQTSEKEGPFGDKFRKELEIFGKLAKWPLVPELVKEEDLLTLGIGKTEDYFQNGVFKFKKVATLGQKAVFGELALQKNAPRAATIIAQERVEMCTLSRAVFQNIFSSAMNKDREKEAFFERNFPFLQKASLNKLSYDFKESKRSFRSILFKAGEPVKEIFVIKSGEVEVLFIFAIKTVIEVVVSRHRQM